MDRRIVFFMVFILTVITTIMVMGVALLAGQSWLHTVLYGLAAMWVMGIASQILLQTLYQNIATQIHEQQIHEREQQQEAEINIEEIDDIDQVEELRSAVAAGGAGADEPAPVGRNVERTG